MERGNSAAPRIFMQLTAQTIAEHLGGTVEGNPLATVSSLAKIEEAGEGTLSFIANPKYEHHIYTTGATAVLVKRDFLPEHPVSATLIRVDDPYTCLGTLLGLAAQFTKPVYTGIEAGAFVADGVEVPAGCYIGAGAYVAKGVSLGENVKIYPHAYIGDGVTIGADSTVYPGAVVYHGCRIGARCTIHAGAVVGADGFGFAPDSQGHYHKIEQIGIVEIDDDVEIGANTTVDRATMGRTHIARGVKLDNLVQIAHNVEVGEDTVMAAQAGVAGSTKVGAGCMFGGQVGLAGHITIGDGVQLGAQSGVPNSIAAGRRMMGTPAVAAGTFARAVAYQKRLADLFAEVDRMAKEIETLKKIPQQ